MEKQVRKALQKSEKTKRLRELTEWKECGLREYVGTRENVIKKRPRLEGERESGSVARLVQATDWRLLPR